MQNLTTFIKRLDAFLAQQPPLISALYQTLAVLAGALVLWLVAKRVLGSFEKKFRDTRFFQGNPEIFDTLRRGGRYVLILAAGTYLLRLFHAELLEKAFHAAMIVLLAGPLKGILVSLLGYLEKNIARKTDTKIDNILFDLLNKFAGVILYATASILALDLLGINVMPFVAGAGVAGIAIGFAAKDTLSNLIAGVLLIIDRPFEIGDRIEVWSAPRGTATWGDVIDIGLRATRIKTTDHIIIIIPNNEIMKRDIINYTAISSMIRVRVNIGVSYDSDIAKAKNIIRQVAESADWIARQPPPKVVVRHFGESSVDLQLRVWITDARRRMDTISYITDRVKTEFDRHAIEIPYPKRDITIIHENRATTTAAADPQS